MEKKEKEGIFTLFDQYHMQMVINIFLCFVGNRSQCKNSGYSAFIMDTIALN